MRVRRAREFLASEGYPNFAMNLFGEAVFTLVREDEVPYLSKLFHAECFDGCRIIFSKISRDGVRLVS